MPAKNDWIADKPTKPQTMREGNLSTRPVSRYSKNTGTKNPTASDIRTKASIVKNLKGLYCLNKPIIVMIT